MIFVMRMLTVSMVAWDAPALVAQDLSPKLTVGESPTVVVRDRVALTRALRPCARAPGCEGIMIETCDRCSIVAERAGKGYSLHLRTGPPGPFYIAVRSDPANTAPFTLEETEAVLATYLDNGQTEPDWYQWKEEDLPE